MAWQHGPANSVGASMSTNTYKGKKSCIAKHAEKRKGSKEQLLSTFSVFQRQSISVPINSNVPLRSSFLFIVYTGGDIAVKRIRFR
jgi:hypothetical protein